MALYQNYYPQQIPNYQQQNFNNYVPNFQQERMNFQPQTIPGKVVADFNNININEIPMDGNSATFIKNDGSEIQLRAWKADGTISKIVFKPVLDEKGINVSEDKTNALNEQISTLESKIDSIQDMLSKMNKPTRTKKEVQEDA